MIRYLLAAAAGFAAAAVLGHARGLNDRAPGARPFQRTPPTGARAVIPVDTGALRRDLHPDQPMTRAEWWTAGSRDAHR